MKLRRHVRIQRASVIAGFLVIFSLASTSPALTRALTPPSAGPTTATSPASAAYQSHGPLGPWQSAPPIAAPRTAVEAVRVGGYVFAQGAALGASPGYSIERATINADGTLGTWQAAGPIPPSGGRAIAVDNHLYLISYSQISWTTVEADGSLGPWQVRPGYTTELRWGGFAVAAAKGYLYALGGWNPIGRGNRYHASVERAPINADGSVGPWQETSSLPIERWGLEAVVAGDYLYALGGHAPIPSREAASDRVERALIHPDGSLGPWELMPPS